MRLFSKNWQETDFSENNDPKNQNQANEICIYIRRERKGDDSMKAVCSFGGRQGDLEGGTWH